MTNPELTKVAFTDDGGLKLFNDWPSSEVSVEHGEATSPSEAYKTVEALIEAGIQQSREDGFPYLKIKIDEIWQPLGEYLASGIYKRGLRDEELKELLARYLDVINAEDGMAKERQHLGAVALYHDDSEKPWERYDAAQRAAGEYLEK